MLDRTVVLDGKLNKQCGRSDTAWLEVVHSRNILGIRTATPDLSDLYSRQLNNTTLNSVNKYTYFNDNKLSRKRSQSLTAKTCSHLTEIAQKQLKSRLLFILITLKSTQWIAENIKTTELMIQSATRHKTDWVVALRPTRHKIGHSRDDRLGKN